MEKNRLVVVIVILSLFVLALGGFIVYDKVLNTNNDENKKNYNVRLLTNEEAIIEGKILYDRVTEIYETWMLIPYCGVDINSIRKDNIEKLGSDACMNGSYYKSDFSSLGNLKEYLKRWLSEEIIDNRVVKSYEYNGKIHYEYVEDVSLLSNCDEEYMGVNYVLKDNTLYCRLDTGKGWMSFYDSYDMKVDAIEENKIIYTITSAYVKPDSNCYLGMIDSKPCGKEDFEYKDTNFVIEKNESGNFVVTEFTLHD